MKEPGTCHVLLLSIIGVTVSTLDFLFSNDVLNFKMTTAVERARNFRRVLSVGERPGLDWPGRTAQRADGSIPARLSPSQ